MRAGGIGLWRIAAPTLLMGALVSAVSLVLYVWAVPYATARSAEILATLRGEQDNVALWVPPKGQPELLVTALKFDVRARMLSSLLICEYKDGLPVETLLADSATWSGRTMILHHVKKELPDGQVLLQTDQMAYDLGPPPEDFSHASNDTASMTMAELQTLLTQPPPADPAQRKAATDLHNKALEEWNFRIAVPWAALGLALIGLPLGIRPVRTSTGVGLGISLAVILAYYIAMSAMRILGQKENLPPMVADWLPNMLLYTTGLGLLINKSR
jgi:lipopolysaccharide export system permease protein